MCVCVCVCVGVGGACVCVCVCECVCVCVNKGMTQCPHNVPEMVYIVLASFTRPDSFLRSIDQSDESERESLVIKKAFSLPGFSLPGFMAHSTVISGFIGLARRLMVSNTLMKMGNHLCEQSRKLIWKNK